MAVWLEDKGRVLAFKVPPIDSGGGDGANVVWENELTEPVLDTDGKLKRGLKQLLAGFGGNMADFVAENAECLQAEWLRTIGCLTHYDMLPLALFLEAGAVRAAQQLLQLGVSPDLLDGASNTALTALCRKTYHTKGDFVVVRGIAWLLAQEPVRANLNTKMVGSFQSTKTRGRSALRAAIKSQNAGAVQLLVDAGVDAFTAFGGVFGHNTPVLTAHRQRNWPILDVLYQAKRNATVMQLPAWRPSEAKHQQFPLGCREALRAMLLLARAQTITVHTDTGKTAVRAHYPGAWLCELPNEILQYLFAYLTAAPVPCCWAVGFGFLYWTRDDLNRKTKVELGRILRGLNLAKTAPRKRDLVIRILGYQARVNAGIYTYRMNHSDNTL